MALKIRNGQACAVCRYQRRRCTTECLLAPYFPADQPKMFQNAHKLFGVNNIKKILEHLSLDQKIIAAKTVKYVANMWNKYPVHGPLVEIRRLIYQIQVVAEELQAALAQLASYRQQHQLQDMSHDTHNTDSLHAAVTLFPVTLNVSYSNNFNSFSDNYSDAKVNDAANALWLQQMNSNNYNASLIAMQSELTSQPMSIQQDTTQDIDEIHKLFYGSDYRKSYIGSMRLCGMESSTGYSRQVIEQMDEKELKNAAGCFTFAGV
ncbi:hypothetical protein F511_02849 [Dorcoceras hygrometricum]|uniref:LOB domain-containing protein n=1 Tax=Dorcoceras hygrometricum TaxID=472368 RepID=A0A2Z7AIT1_9LAMI|nr:hypothetical protein F511_02849 [Dorcoceras hygrometricum]